MRKIDPTKPKRKVTATPIAIGQRIRDMRRARQWRQEDLAEAAGMLPAAINHIECGRRMPRLKTLDRLRAVLEVDWNQLLMGVDL